MVLRLVLVGLLCAGCAAQKSGTGAASVSLPPATEASTRPVRVATTQASTTFPTPAELFAKIKQLQSEKEALSKVAYFDLTTHVAEKPADFSLFGRDSRLTLRTLIERLHKARDDKSIRAALMILAENQFNLAQAQEIRDALKELNKAGKQTFVYADSYDTTTYTVASGASHVCLLGGGEIVMPGVQLEATFAKGLLDKVGVQADYIQIGEYKGADEAITRTTASPELRGELNKLTDSLYGQIVEGISRNRKMPAASVKRLIDQAMISAKQAKQARLVDHLVDMDGLRDLMGKQLKNKVDVIPDYGAPERREVDFSNLLSILALMAKKPEVSIKPTVAIIYADGVIVDGDGGDGLFGAGIGSDDIRKAFRIASRDKNVKAIVLRIDSPGGSALASEAMWQAARRAAKDKPLIVSIGSMAASGGYYLASSGEYIFADSTAIVGSIGVVGGKFVIKDLYAKIGLTSEAFNRGKNAGLFSMNQPFDEKQRMLITNWMKETYDQFIERIMTTRTGKIKNIDEVARGRIFIASQAKELGMVDEIGGIESAIAYAAKKVKLAPASYDVRVLPAPKTLADILSGDPETQMPFGPKVSLAGDSILRSLSPAVRRTLMQHVQIVQLIQERPVMLVSPYIITVK